MIGEPRHPVRWWPAPLPPVADGLVVIGVEGGGGRTEARVRIRAALRDALAGVAGLAPDAVVIHSEPGRAPAVSFRGAAGKSAPGIAFSHEEPWSLAAINLCGPVGIDLMRVHDLPDWHAVAHDYLGPETAGTLATMDPARRPAAFARAWTEHEARLKCLGMQLAEWSPALASELRGCAVRALALPDGLVGTLAFRTTPAVGSL